MIRALRRRHRLIWIVLAILLPLVFILGLLARNPRPANPDAVIERAVGGQSR